MSNQSNPDALVAVLLEEAGHRIDAQLNAIDRAGDEGAYFSALVIGNEISSEQRAVQQAEDDSTTVNLAGQSIRLEQNNEVTIEGTFKWVDNAGVEHPIRNGWVEVREDDLLRDDTVTGGATDNNGNYKLTIPIDRILDLVGAGEVYVSLRSAAFNYPFNIAPSENIFNKFFTYESPTKVVSQAGIYNPPEFSKIFESNSEMGEVFSIYDAILVGNIYAGSVSPRFEELANIWNKNDTPLIIRYPDEKDTLYENDTVVITVREDEKYDWDVILHEYGHFLDVRVDGLSNKPTGRFEHSVGKSINTDYGKEVGVRLAWHEGLANYLGIASQHVVQANGQLPLVQYGSDYSTTGRFTGDTWYTDASPIADTRPGTRTLDYNLEASEGQRIFHDGTPSEFIGNQGEGDEAPVTRILWDLADNNEDVFVSGLKDEISIGHVELYKILVDIRTWGKLDQLQDVWNYFQRNLDKLNLGEIPDNHKLAKLGAIFEEYNVSPQPTKIPTSSSQLSGFEWKVGNSNVEGTNEGQRIGNDEFTIFVFNENFESYFSKTLDQTNKNEWTLDSITGIASWNPSEEDWSQIKPGNNYLVIAGSDTVTGIGEGSPHTRTGLYWSGAYSFTVAPPRRGERIRGSEGNDRLTGTDGTDLISGFGGRDRITGGNGNDHLRGGSGNDLLLGEDGDDRLVGDSGNDRLSGGTGNDRLYGEDGDDFLSAGENDNQLIGGAGRDTFRLDPLGYALIEDFNVVDDQISLGNIQRTQLDFVQENNSTVIKLQNTTIARLNGVNSSLLSDSNFV